MKFPTTEFILKNDMSADKMAFHKIVKKKKNWPFWKVFKNLWQKNHQLETTYLVDLSNIYSSTMPAST
jgi:hypothetical protein